MSEQQNIEYKQSWHDDYLKWVCGFANAIGGMIYIGIDNKGNVVHLANYAKLMEDIPGKNPQFDGNNLRCTVGR
jgi:ATP-dependent DNA helicase RecG